MVIDKMSQKKPADVEMKPVSRRSYQNEPEFPEQIEEFKFQDPLLNSPPEQRPNNLPSTPNIPTPTPRAQPNPPSPSPNISPPTPQIPPQYSNNLKLVKCSVCSLMLQCSHEVCFVSCPRCLNLTAIKQMNAMMCTYCRRVSYFPIDAISIRCYCGAMYSNPYLRAN